MTASGINGSVMYDVDAMLPLSDEVALVLGDVVKLFVELFTLLHCNPTGLTKYCFIPIIWRKRRGRRKKIFIKVISYIRWNRRELMATG